MCIEEYIAFDPTDAPEVLTFQIRAGTPTIDLERERVFSGMDIGIDEEFGRILGVFAIARFVSVDIDIESGLGSGYMEVDIALHPVRGYFYLAPIHTYGVGFRQFGRLRIARLKLVSVIGVDSHTVPLYLPVAGDLDVVPSVCICRAIRYAGRQMCLALGIKESPRAVQKTVVRTLLILAGESFASVGIGHKGRTRRFFVYAYRTNILPIWKPRLCDLCLCTENDTCGSQSCRKCQ